MTRGRAPRSVAISIGDPHGIGPEVTLRAMARLQPWDWQPHLFADGEYLRALASDLGLRLNWKQLRLHPIATCPYPPPWGRPGAESGSHALRSLEGALEFYRGGGAPLLVTAPLHKLALHEAGFSFPGQTEFIASKFPPARGCMAFFSRRLNVMLATTHLPLAEVPSRLSSGELVSQGLLFAAALRRLGFETPRLAVCGLNPHASEGGLFGSEEERIVSPAVRELSRRLPAGSVSGPLAADSLFHRALEGEFDGVIALYHDQGLIPLKAVAFDNAVNTTLGLPIVRTSPDHGTAMDIAGQGAADCGSMVEAFRVGLRLAFPK